MKQKQRYWAIIPAAGSGVRMGAEIPKQYLPLNGKPLLEHTVDIITACEPIEKVVVVLHAQDHYWQHLHYGESSKIITVIGGSLRAHSVLLGLECIQNITSAHDWVLVHDAVRPCISQKLLTNLMNALEHHPIGGLLGIPLLDTLKRVDDNNRVSETLARDHLWCAQTPQLFRFELLFLALSQALQANQTITDEASAIERMGLQPEMILGDSRNIKITFPSDLRLAESLLGQSS